ncbi:hypothetical protein BN946_scf184969.g58 [Trametes cinnabarina]|uniref:Enoyl reductase (ER) domain-containing protein n=1 Tax=Pycnoporus cinnabarinus TaxID=5643 RepID=A0A060ST37_PYCCI|nr:hypothetical protein BN946_scf184969.g58 [Trametes cinnabarina]
MLAIVSVGIANMLILQRVVILWEHRPIILKTMTVGFLLSFSLQVVSMVFTLLHVLPSIQWSEPVGMCIATKSSHILIAVWASPLVFEMFVLSSTALNALDRPRTLELPIIKALHSDGLGFFLAITCLRILNLILAALSRPSLTFLGVFFIWAMTTTILNRLLLHLRRAECRPSPSDPFSCEFETDGQGSDVDMVAAELWDRRRSRAISPFGLIPLNGERLSEASTLSGYSDQEQGHARGLLGEIQPLPYVYHYRKRVHDPTSRHASPPPPPSASSTYCSVLLTSPILFFRTDRYWDTMRAFVINDYAHPSKIPIIQGFPEPKASKGQVLVDVYSAGLNYFDILQSQGKYQVQPPRPFVLGNEFAGKISADSPIPDGCPFRPGDRVFGGGQGAYAEKVAVAWQNLVPLPDNMSYDQGAALGAKVIAAAGSQEKLDISVRHGGADHGVNYSKDGWQKEVLKITGGKGVDVVYDPVGLIRDSLKCIAWKGRAIVVGFAAGSIEKLPLNLVLLKNISIVGIHWGAYTKFEPTRVPVVWRSLLDLFSSGRAKPIVYPETFPLERLADGLQAIEKRKTWGKVIVHVRDPERSQARAKL